MTKEESTKIVKFHYPGAGVLALGHGHRVKMKYFFSSSCLHWGMDQTIMCTCIVRIYLNCKFHDPRTGVLRLRCGLILVSHYSE